MIPETGEPGPLERSVLDVLRRVGPADPVQVHRVLAETRVIGAATVRAAVDRLLQRGLVVADDERVAPAPSGPAVGPLGAVVPTSGLRPTALVPMCEPWPPRPAGCC